ncbi:unnamed protein product [Colias eurytheme]|nr:unnamed protein product [Colias eurytheme]
MMQCGACLQMIKESKNKILRCSKCLDTFHALCGMQKIDEFNKLSADAKANWTCTPCNIKQKKPGNNSETPVRAAITPSTNITQRLKQNINIPSPSSTLSSSPGSTNISTDTLRTLIREELKNALHDYVEEKIGSQLKEIRKEIEDFRSSLSFISEQYDEIKTDYQTKFKTLQDLVSENTSLRSSVQVLTSRFNQLDQLSRASNLEIQCVPEYKQENIPTMELDYKFVWIRGGRIFLKKIPTSNAILVRDLDDLKNLKE